MSTKLERNHSRFEIIKNIVEIVAILVTAIWAFYTFSIKDEPSLSDSLVAASQIFIKPKPVGCCQIQYLINAKNIGKSIFSVDSLNITYWTMPISYITDPEFFDIDGFIKENLARGITHKFTKNGTLLTVNYMPSFGYSQDFLFNINYDNNKAILFKYKFYVSSYNYFFRKSNSSITGHQWVYPIAPPNRQ
jgi:hypothetical protein